PSVFERSRQSQQIVPLAEKIFWMQFFLQQLSDLTRYLHSIDPIESLCADVSKTRRELIAQQIEQPEDNFSKPGCIGRMLKQRQFGFVVENFIEHYSRVAFGRCHRLRSVLRVLA